MRSTALINIDFINDIVHEDGVFGQNYAQIIKERAVIHHANEVIRFARANNVLNIYIKVAFSSDYREISANNSFFGRAVELNGFKMNTWGTEFHKDLDYQEGEIIVYKHRISPLYNTNLECILNAHQIKQLMITGVATDLAVQMLARDAVDRDYKVIVCKDACAGLSNEIQDATMISLARMAKVITNKELNSNLLI